MRLRLLLVLLLSLAGGAPVAAQPSDIIWCRQPVFRIPFQIEASEQGRLREVQLYLQEGTGKPWRLIKTVGPNERHFPFRAEADGLHQFMVRTIDIEGKAYPPRVEEAAPGLRVMVDTVLPVAMLRQLPARGDQLGFEWEVRDDNLDVLSLQVDYRGQGAGEWQPLMVDALAVGQKYFVPAARGPIEVRLRVKDRAENQGSAYLVLQGSGFEPLRRETDSFTSRNNPVPAYSTQQREVKVINSTEMNLNYSLEDVGPSGVSVVELWFTRDGRTWQRQGEDPDKTSPFQVRFNSEGQYGLTLVVKSGVGLGDRPPQTGDVPQMWVEVDLTKPVVEVKGVEAGRGADAGNLTIQWRAEDKNLAAAPISLSYAENPEGPWTSMVGGLENTGRYVWRIPPGTPYRFHVRVEAVDKGGNIGHADTPKPVIVDLSLPRGRLTGVDSPARP
uniref:Fibronectin type III domain-containing protein n=1 Tax=Schlesneria paludicola TaxID=360056 RepID=A0A7C2NXQ8_9PLAN